MLDQLAGESAVPDRIAERTVPRSLHCEISPLASAAGMATFAAVAGRFGRAIARKPDFCDAAPA
jgi:hypothetical protein